MPNIPPTMNWQISMANGAADERRDVVAFA
jgi:hypothetical protein